MQETIPTFTQGDLQETGNATDIALITGTYGRYTVPEFIGDRFNSHPARITAAICTIIISFTYSIGQLSESGVVIGRLFEIDAKIGTMIGVVRQQRHGPIHAGSRLPVK